MYTEQVKNEGSHGQQRRNAFFITCLPVPAAKSLHCLRRIPGRSWQETDSPLPVRKDFYDLIVPLFPFAGVTGMPSLSERMKPADDLRGNRDSSLSAENPIQRPAIPRKF